MTTDPIDPLSKKNANTISETNYENTNDELGLLQLSDFCYHHNHNQYQHQHRRRRRRRSLVRNRRDRRQRGVDEGSHLRYNNNNNNHHHNHAGYSEENNNVEVEISILQTVPKINTVRAPYQPPTTNDEDNNGTNDDPYATAYTDDPNLFRVLGVFDNSICQLFVTTTHNSVPSHRSSPWTGRRWVPFVLRLVEDGSLPSTLETTPISSPLLPSQSHCRRPTNGFALHLPPTLAFDLGLCGGWGYHHHYHNTTPTLVWPVATNLRFTVQPYSRSYERCCHSLVLPMVRRAIKASLREVAFPPSDFLPSLDLVLRSNQFRRWMNRNAKKKKKKKVATTTTTTTRTEVNETKKEVCEEENNKESISIDTIWEQHEQNRKTNQIKSLQNHFYQRSTMARPVVRKRLVSYGSLIAVPINECEYDIGTDDARTDDARTEGRPRQRKSNEEMEQSFRFYEVVSLCSDTHIDGMDKNDNQNDETEEKNDDEEDDDDAVRTRSNPYDCFWISPATELVLLPRSTDTNNDGRRVKRMPSKTVLSEFYASIDHVSYLPSEEDEKEDPEENVLAGGRSRERRRRRRRKWVEGMNGSDGVSSDGTTSVTVPSSSSNSDPYHYHHHHRLYLHHRHTNVDAVTNALYLLGRTGRNGNMLLSPNEKGAGSLLSSHTLRVVGVEDDGVSVCLDAAADRLGMNIVHIHGLAAFAYRYESVFIEGGGDTTSTTTVQTTGSIVDRIRGLTHAFRIARRCAPCVLHVGRFEEELGEYVGGGEEEEDVRRDEEHRLLSCMMEEMQESCSLSAVADYGDRYGSNMDESGAALVEEDVPSVLLVISTSTSLPTGGPISNRLFHESLSIGPPGEDYARALWQDDDTFEEIKSYIMGRTAREIISLGQRFNRVKKKTPEPSTKESSHREGKWLSLLQEIDDVSTPSTKTTSASLIPDVRWEDVGGLAHVRDEVKDAVELPTLYPGLFRGTRRSGILLFGPPGSGKTLVAKALATECGVPFLSVKGPELLGSYVGESEANVREAFDSARKAATEAAAAGGGGVAILFFDEIDSLAPRREGEGEGGKVMERVVATILGELDKEAEDVEGDDDGNETGVIPQRGRVILVGATNRPDLLDPSLLRPGRFDRLVYLGLATKRQDRIAILAAQMRKFRFEGGADAKSMASKVVDSIPDTLTGADLSAVASGALRRAISRLCEEVDRQVEALRDNGDGVVVGGSSATDNLDTTVVEHVVSDWTEEQLCPTVTANDLIESAKAVSPSVDENDMKKYEELKRQFCD